MPKDEAAAYTRQYSPCEISVSKFALFSSNLYDSHSMFSEEQIQRWIELAIPIFLTYLPDNVFVMERSCVRFLSGLSEDHLPIMLKCFIDIIRVRYSETFPNEISGVIFDPTDKKQIETCFLMNYFITVLDKIHLDNVQYHSQKLNETLKTPEFKEAFTVFLNVHRCLLWHSSVQDLKRMV